MDKEEFRKKLESALDAASVKLQDIQANSEDDFEDLEKEIYRLKNEIENSLFQDYKQTENNLEFLQGELHRFNEDLDKLLEEVDND